MELRKIEIAVYCENEQERVAIQNIAKEISGMFDIKAKDVIGFYPFVKKNKALLYTAVKTVANEGKKGALKLLPMLIKNL